MSRTHSSSRRRPLNTGRLRPAVVATLIALGSLGLAVGSSSAHGPVDAARSVTSRFPGSADSIERWAAAWVETCVENGLTANALPGVADRAERTIDSLHQRLVVDCTRALAGDLA